MASPPPFRRRGASYAPHDAPATAPTRDPSSRTDVVIVGAGPTGSYLANRLTALGVRFVLVERRRREEIRARRRAGLLEHRVVARLRRHGLADGLLAEGEAHRGATFRTPHGQIELDMAAHCDGKTRTAYPQSRLVEDLITRALADGADLRFGCEATSVVEDDDGVALECRTPDGELSQLRADYLIATDGHAGLGRRLATARGIAFRRYRFGHDWLAIMAEVGPSAPHAIYGIHPRGFAGHMIRTHAQTRFYLQIAATDDVDAWSDARIWDELEHRLAAPNWSLRRGAITSKRRLALRSEIAETMVDGRLLLAGDAAHLMPPCGGKGMNLGIMDVEALAEPLARCVREGHDPARLQAWSRARLADTWTTFQFSHAMVELLHNVETQPDNAQFSALLKTRWLEHLGHHGGAGAEFSRRYIGL